jgi:hypothetical protein
MNNSDLEPSLHEKALHREIVFAIRKFLVCADDSMRERHIAVFNVLKPLAEEANYMSEVWLEDDVR